MLVLKNEPYAVYLTLCDRTTIDEGVGSLAAGNVFDFGQLHYNSFFTSLMIMNDWLVGWFNWSVGWMIDAPIGQRHLWVYFDWMVDLSGSLIDRSTD